MLLKAQRIFAVIVTTAIVLMAGVSAQAQGQGQAQQGGPGRWVRMAAFPDPDEELYGIAANGKMYVVGGFAGGKMGLVHEYDPATDKWATKKTMPTPVHHQAMAEFHGKIYVFGGYTSVAGAGGGGWAPVDNAWEYDPVADSWKALAPLPSKRGSAIAAEVGGKIYVIGGAVPGGTETAISPIRAAHSVGTNDVYDPATNKYESRSPMPTARNHAFSGVVNGKIYVIGGRLAHSFISVASNTDVVEEYDPATNEWGAVKAKMPTPRSGGASGTYGGKIYTTGGEWQTPQWQATFRAFEAYDPATNTWASLPALPLPRHGVAGAFLGNKFHLVSGRITPGGVGGPDTQSATSEHDVYEVPEK